MPGNEPVRCEQEGRVASSVEDPSIERLSPPIAVASHAVGGASSPHAITSKQSRGVDAAGVYQQKLPQTTFLEELKRREKRLVEAIQRSSANTEAEVQTTNNSLVRAQAPSTAGDDHEKRPIRSAKSERVQQRRDLVHSAFPNKVVKDPFCPKPPVHASPIRLEASIRTAKRLFADRGAPGVGDGRPQTAPQPVASSPPSITPQARTDDVELPAIVAPPTVAQSLGAPQASETDDEAKRASCGGAAHPLERLWSAQHSHRSFASTDSQGDMERLLQFLPKDYREPEIVLTEHKLIHPCDPVTGKPRPKRRYRLGLQHDPAKDVDPGLAAAAVHQRGLPTKLSVGSTDPAVLAIVDAFIESSPGLEQVDLGSMDDRYEMVLRNVYAALSRNVSIGVVTGELPKAAARAFKETIHANTERRMRRLTNLAMKERELKIADMEKRILAERQEVKKIQFEQMRQRTRLVEHVMRRHREILREELEGWLVLCQAEGESLAYTRQQEQRRQEWWASSVSLLEADMLHARGQDSREEHQLREAMRLDEVNARLAAQIGIRRIQKQMENDRHAILTEQFNARKAIGAQEKSLRRAIESELVDHLRAFLDAKAIEERHRRELEAARLEDERRRGERRRKLDNDRDILLENELEKRKTIEMEAQKLYDGFKRKHFEGIVVAKNSQRMRETKERRQAAFALADSTVPSLHFRMTPQTSSATAVSSTVPVAANTVTYHLNTVGDFRVLNPDAVLGVQFETEPNALTARQKLTKVTPQGAVLSVRITRNDMTSVDRGREGIVLYIPTDPQTDANVEVSQFVAREPGATIVAKGYGDVADDDATSSAEEVSVVPPPTTPNSAKRRTDGRGVGVAQTTAAGQKTQDEIDAEVKVQEMCGHHRVFGYLRVRDEGQSELRREGTQGRSRLRRKSSSSAIATSREKLHQVGAELLNNLLEIESEEDEDDDDMDDRSDSDHSTDGTTTSSFNMQASPRKGFGSCKQTEPVGPPRRPKRRIVSWNGEDIGYVEIGFAGAPMHISRMTPYYLNTAIHKVRSRESSIVKQLRRRRGTVDVVETSTPTDPALDRDFLVAFSDSQTQWGGAGAGAPNNGRSSRRSTFFGSRVAKESHETASSANSSVQRAVSVVLDEPRHDVEVFRMRFFKNASRHGISEVLAHLCYFNADGVPDIREPDIERLTSDVVRVSSTLSVSFPKSSLPPQSAFGGDKREESSVFARLEQQASTSECSVMLPDDATDLSSPMTPSRPLRSSHLVWSTRTTHAYVKLEFPMLLTEPQRDNIFFLEDQDPLRLCPPGSFSLCLPISSLLSPSYVLPSNLQQPGATKGESMQPPSLTSCTTVLGGDTQQAPTLCNIVLPSNSHVLIRDMSNESLDALDVLVGRHSIDSFRLYLTILDHARGDVLVLLGDRGLTIGPDKATMLTPQASDVGADLPPGRRMAVRLDDCSRKEVGVEVARNVREILYKDEVVAIVDGLLLNESDYEKYQARFAVADKDAKTSAAQVDHATSGGPQSSLSVATSLVASRTLWQRLRESNYHTGPVRIQLLPSKVTDLAFLRDLLMSVAYANLNKDPSAVSRHVDVTLTDHDRTYSAVVRRDITVVPVDDITEIQLCGPPWGYQVYRGPTECRTELQSYLPREIPLLVCPNATAKDPDSLYFEGGWLEVEITEGMKDGDVVYLLQDERLQIDEPHEWSFDTVRTSNALYISRLNAREEANRQQSAAGAATEGPQPPVSRRVSLHVADALNRFALTPQSPAVSHTDRSSPLIAPLEGATTTTTTHHATLVYHQNQQLSLSNNSPPHHHHGGLNDSTTIAFSGESSLPRPSANGPPPGSAARSELVSLPPVRVTMSAFTEDEDEPSSEMFVVAGLALENPPPQVSRRDMSRGRVSGGSFSKENNLVAPTPLGSITPESAVSLTPGPGNGLRRPSGDFTPLDDRASLLTYASPLLRIEFNVFSLAALQYLLRRIAFKSVSASEKNPRYFGTRKICIRAIVGDPTIPKFRKFDPFVPIVKEIGIKVCEPLLKSVMPVVTYKEGQGVLSLPFGVVDAGSDGYRCFNRGFLSAAIVKGATPEDRIFLRSVDPSQFDYGMTLFDVDPTTIFQQKRSMSIHALKRMSNFNRPTSGSGGAADSAKGYTPGGGGVGPDGEVNANCPPPPPALYQQWVKGIASGKYKIQQWKCCEVYNNERAMLGFYTSTASEFFLGFREFDKVRKYGKAAPPPSPSKRPEIANAPGTLHALGSRRRLVAGKTQLVSNVLDREANVIPVHLPDGATPIRYTDLISLTKLIAYENRSSNPKDLKKVVLLSASDESTTSHMVLEINVLPVDDATEIRRSIQGPLTFRQGSEMAYIPVLEHCTLHDPDTEHFNGAALSLSLTHAAMDGDQLRLMTLDEQRRHREAFLKDPYAKYRSKPKLSAAAAGVTSNAAPSGADAGTVALPSAPSSGFTRTHSKPNQLSAAALGQVRGDEAAGGDTANSAADERDEATKDPLEPYEFVLDRRRNVIYWLDRNAAASKKRKESEAGEAPSSTSKFQFVTSGAFSLPLGESPKQMPFSAPLVRASFDASNPKSIPTPADLGLRIDEGELRRIGTFSVCADAKLKAKSEKGNRAVQQRLSEAKPTTEPSVNESSAFLTSVNLLSVPEIVVGDQEVAGITNEQSATSGKDAGAKEAKDSTSNFLGVHIKFDALIPDEDVEEDSIIERPAPVTIQIMQALMRCIIYSNSAPPTKVRPGPRTFLTKIASGGAEDGKAKIVVQTFGSLLGWLDNWNAVALFRPRMGMVMPLNKLLFTNDLIIKAGFLLIEICEGFEPLEDVLKLGEIGRTFGLKNGRLVMQPKDVLIGGFQALEQDGAVYGFLITFDPSCRVSGGMLQHLTRSLTYVNTTRRTGVRKIRVVMCDGGYYETSQLEVVLNVEQDEDTIPIKFGPSGGKVAYLEGHSPVRVFPDITLTLKGFNVNRVLVSPALLELTTQPGFVLSCSPQRGNSDELELGSGCRLLMAGTEVGKVYQAMTAEGFATMHPTAPRRSLTRAFARRATRQQSVVAIQDGTVPKVGSNEDAAASGGGGGSSARGPISPRSYSYVAEGPSPPHMLKIEFARLPMAALQGVIRSIVVSKITAVTAVDGSDPTTVGSGTADSENSSYSGVSGTRSTAPTIPANAASIGAKSRRSMVSFGGVAATPSSGDKEGPSAPAAPQSSLGMGQSISGAGGVAVTSVPVSLMLTGLTGESGKVSNLAAINTEAVVRACESSSMFTLSTTCGPQGPSGDIFSAVHVKFPPRLIRISWAAAPGAVVPQQQQQQLPDTSGGTDESEKESAAEPAATALANSLDLMVSSRLGLVTSANGEEIFYGRDRIAIVGTARSTSTRSKSLFLASASDSQVVGELSGPTHRSSLFCESQFGQSINSAEEGDGCAKDAADLAAQEVGDIDESFSLDRRRVSKDPRLTFADRSPNQIVIALETGCRKLTPELVTRLMKSIVCHPVITCSVEFTIYFEASDECMTQMTYQVNPNVRRLSRSPSSTLATKSSQRKSGAKRTSSFGSVGNLVAIGSFAIGRRGRKAE